MFFKNSISHSLFSSRKSLGAFGEQFAEEYLRKLGWKVIAKNWRCRVGELDMVCIEANAIVFVEVKSRIFSSFAEKHLFATITVHKQQKLRLLQQSFLRQYPRFQAHKQMRIDVIGVLIRPECRAESRICHVRAAVSAGF